MILSTNWVKYYKAPIGLAYITRWLSAKKILLLISKYIDKRAAIEICELGGANSCFLLPLCAGLNVKRYHVIDNCGYGLKLLDKKKIDSRVIVSLQNRNVLEYANWERNSFNLVLSVGLIEHFNQEGTSKAIAAHFSQVRTNGLVLITFPTPTRIYLLLRSFLERIGKWNFPDERPLSQEEVRICCKQYGIVIHESINYGAVLTQGYILVKSF